MAPRLSERNHIFSPMVASLNLKAGHWPLLALLVASVLIAKAAANLGEIEGQD